MELEIQFHEPSSLVADASFGLLQQVSPHIQIRDLGALGSQSREFGLDHQACLANISKILFRLEQPPCQDSLQETRGCLFNVCSIARPHANHAYKRKRLERLPQSGATDSQRR